MINIDLKPFLEQGESRYGIVQGVAKRARAISDKNTEQNDVINDEKSVTTALNELVNYEISILPAEENAKK